MERLEVVNAGEQTTGTSSRNTMRGNNPPKNVHGSAKTAKKKVVPFSVLCGRIIYVR